MTTISETVRPITLAVRQHAGGVSLAEPIDLSGLTVTINFSYFPFTAWITNMVGGMWAIGITLLVAAWILAVIAWVFGHLSNSGGMKQYAGTVFVWLAIGTVVMGSAVALVKFFAAQTLF